MAPDSHRAILWRAVDLHIVEFVDVGLIVVRYGRPILTRRLNLRIIGIAGIVDVLLVGHGRSSLARCGGSLQNLLVHIPKWHPLFARDPRTVLILRRDDRLLAFAPTAFAAHGAPRGLDRD